MPTISVLPHAELCPLGTQFEVEAGANLCESLLDNDVYIEHACEQSCACTTCHVYVRAGLEALPPADEFEEDQLDKAWGLQFGSRLSCQIMVADNDLTIEIPRYSINHAKELKK